ncbi:hypothetical protein ACFL34_00070 [Candidatus Sumerlaeota bacterium]
MTVFPRREAKILALGQSLIAGLTANVVDFPAPAGRAQKEATLKDAPHDK